jgi:hypothetical protein
MESDCVAAYVQWRKLAGDSQADVDTLQGAYRDAGRVGFEQLRRKILKARLESARKTALTKLPGAVVMAARYAAIGDHEQAYVERNPRLTWIKSSLDWEPLRSDPRYQSLVRRMDLPD